MTQAPPGPVAEPRAQEHQEQLPLRTRLTMFLRLLAIQSSWNYEILLGNGVGFCVEPALRRLPGGRDGVEYREALARQSNYFNAHPYLASVAIGALASAELTGEAPERIERFRTALCGPLGSLGDRLVWAAWLPFCSLVALGAFGFGAGPVATVLLFLLLYNTGHLALRVWGLHVGLTRGLKVATSLGSRWLRNGPEWLGQAAALLSGITIPVALYRVAGAGSSSAWTYALILLLALAGGLALSRIPARLEGWRIAITGLALYVLVTMVR
jgi:PTS system mannose-specific IID component